MPMDRLGSVVTSLFAITILAACTNPDPELNDPREAVTSYFQARRDFGEALGRAVAAEQGPIYRIVAITGPQYPVGSALDPRNPADTVAPACVVPEPQLVPWTPFPETSSVRSIRFEATLPALLQRALPTLAEFGVEASANSTARWSMQDVAQRLAPQSLFQQAISSGECRTATAGRDILFVRGVIYSKEMIASTRALNISAAANATGGGVNVVADRNGAFRVEDSSAIPRYHILTFKAAEVPAPGASLRDVELATPPDDVLSHFMGVQVR